MPTTFRPYHPDQLLLLPPSLREWLPEELRRREDRLAIRAAKEPLRSRQREADDARGRDPGSKRNPKGGRPYKREHGEPEESAQDNFTDPQSRIMKTSAEGFQQCYNAQLAVEGSNQLIVAAEVSSNASDQGHLVALLDDVETTRGERSATVLADAGYCNEADLGRLEERGVDGHVALGREGRRMVRRMRRSIRRRRAWPRSWRPRRGGSNTRNANGCPRRRTGGSRKRSASAASACAAWTRCGASGIWSVWH